MKKFKDLQVGDTVFIDFEKKTVTKISRRDNFDEVVIYVSKDEFYLISDHLSFDYCCGPAKWIFIEKDAMIEHFTRKLKDLEIDYETDKFLYVLWLEKAKQLED